MKRLSSLIAVCKHSLLRAERAVSAALKQELECRESHLVALARCDELQRDIQSTEACWLEVEQQDIGDIKTATLYLQARRRQLDSARRTAALCAERFAVAETTRQAAAVALNHARLKHEHAIEQRVTYERHRALVSDTQREEQALENWNVARQHIVH